jgi:Hypothetical protein (DUF2513)
MRDYVEAKLIPFGEPPGVAGMILRMTNSGHDYLDSVRDTKVWNKTKSLLEKVGGSAASEVVKDVAAKVMAELMKPFIGGA